jgi:hypothetical protein
VGRSRCAIVCVERPAVLGIALPDIFDEVDEDLRAEQVRKWFTRYGSSLIAAAVLVVVAVGAWEFWQWRQARTRLAAAEEYFAAMQIADGRPGPGRLAAIPGLAEVEHSGLSGYRTLARLRHAALLADAGKLAEAETLWNAVADDDSADRTLRDLASLQWATSDLDHGNPATLSARLQKLAGPDNPWHGMAEEAQALLALRQGKNDAARDLLKQLSQDQTVPQGVRERAEGLLTQLGAPPAPVVPGQTGGQAGSKTGGT